MLKLCCRAAILYEYMLLIAFSFRFLFLFFIVALFYTASTFSYMLFLFPFHRLVVCFEFRTFFSPHIQYSNIYTLTHTQTTIRTHCKRERRVRLKLHSTEFSLQFCHSLRYVRYRCYFGIDNTTQLSLI